MPQYCTSDKELEVEQKCCLYIYIPRFLGEAMALAEIHDLYS